MHSLILWAAWAAFAAEPREVALVANPMTLAAIEERGFTFGERLDGEASRGFNNSLLSKRPRYGELVRALEADLLEFARKDGGLGTGPGSVHRQLDPAWLRSPRAVWELIGVANRLDRRPFDEGGCGEIRLLYRLAYEAPVGARGRPTAWRGDPSLAFPPARVDPEASEGVAVRSRLPATANVIYRALDERGQGDCRGLARRWIAPAGLSGADLGAWLASSGGPLAPALTASGRLKGIEVQWLTSRWPAEVREDMGGHAEHLLRFFVPTYSGASLVAGELENTPDADLLRRDRRLREELKAWISEPANLARIEDGTALVPRRFLARRAVAASPHGLWRLANRPFRRIFSPQDLADLPLEKRPGLRSAQGLLRRLDGLSCAGCHQGRSVAGFHLLGEDRPAAPVGNALAVPLSPHLLADLPRRKGLIRDLAQGRRVSYAQPPPERGPAEPGLYGSVCGLGDPAFSGWSCGPGLSCHRYLSPEGEPGVGLCFPSSLGRVGDPCEVGRLTPKPDPRADYVDALGRVSCRDDGVCRTNAEGFPAGMCEATCHRLPSGGECGQLPTLRDVATCGKEESAFKACLAENSRPSGLRACSAAAPCRQDYACARAASGRGACTPAWHLLQLRPDGHPRVVDAGR